MPNNGLYTPSEHSNMEIEGFEPSRRDKPTYTLSKGASSAS
ncbi:hypothetical protein OENI_540008 [Oenococcus oeni]|nr:hypothetical protein OENI_540008 [Oenococcus oeni]SYW12907.1 hypothetical protein OENI_60007 [Oenococcus oeni]SYW20821.1 hypothetical protein OENI_770009 [Oenococcus oeni]